MISDLERDVDKLLVDMDRSFEGIDKVRRKQQEQRVEDRWGWLVALLTIVSVCIALWLDNKAQREREIRNELKKEVSGMVRVLSIPDLAGNDNDENLLLFYAASNSMHAADDPLLSKCDWEIEFQAAGLSLDKACGTAGEKINEIQSRTASQKGPLVDSETYIANSTELNKFPSSIRLRSMILGWQKLCGPLS